MFRYPITITIDTSIFDSTTYDLTQDSILCLLKSYVKDKKIKVILSDIVVREVKAHLNRYATDMISAMKNSRKDYLKKVNRQLWILAGAEQCIYIPQSKDIANKMINIFEQYLNDIDADIIETTSVDIKAVLDDYFDFEAPFENNEKKRNEFPDAFVASQIRTTFPDLKSIVIISRDNGFKKACNKNGEYICFSSLGELYNAINKENSLYTRTMEMLKQRYYRLNKIITKEIKDNENITVYGQSYDRKGIISGHEYTETFLKKLINLECKLHSIDEINENEAVVTLTCHCNIEIDCYYEDYENAPWDSEKKEYVFVDTVHILEKHNPNFVCRGRMNIQTGEFTLLPFHIYLGGDSRKDVIEVDDDEKGYDEFDLINDERDEYGLQRLDCYEEYVGEHLRESEMNQEIISALINYQKDMRRLEDIATSCDDFIEQFNKSDDAVRTSQIYNLKKNLVGLKFEYTEKLISFEEDNVLLWLNKLYDKAIINCDIKIPEELELDSIYYIPGLGNSLTIKVDGLSTERFSEGDRELIYITVCTDNGSTSSGTMELTVGYINFDDEGGAGDGIGDTLSFEYNNILKTLNDFINSQKNMLTEYESIKDAINNSIKNHS